MVKKFDALQRSKYWLPLIVLSAMILLIWMGLTVFVQGNYFVGATFIMLAMLLAVFLVFHLTVRVDIDNHSVIRSWLFGRTVVPIEEITRLRWTRSRGVIMLTIGYGKKNYIQLSNYAFTDLELRGMQNEIISIRGLEDQLLTPMYEGQMGEVDLTKMSEFKNKNA